jgi:pimeloyl-ACP methyl ester carboxylesterase
MDMVEAMPILLVPGLASSPRIYAPVVPALWRCGPVMVANHIRDDSMAGIARRILAEAPPRFALAGHSMGGYIAFEIIRQAPERVMRLALLNTQAVPDTPVASERRRGQISRVEAGRFHDVLDELFPGFVHPSRQDDPGLRRLVHDMGDDIGPEAFIRQQTAVMGRPDSRPTLSAIRCPTLVLSGDQDGTIPNSQSVDMADAIAGATLAVIPECGHLSQAERPQATAEALVSWLRG